MTKRTKIEESPQASTEEAPFHLKYRPKTWKDVLGQDGVVRSMKESLSGKNMPHAFTLCGPSGTGKTTLARIAARSLGVLTSNLIEVDAASNTGIDDMRAVMGPLRYVGFGENPNKAIIVDEAHRLSKQAWDSLLKIVEGPPSHVFFFFCTTEDGKIPKAIETRCARYSLRPLRYDDLMDLLEQVREAEDLPTTNRVLELIAKSCNGSPRQALVMLQQAHAAESEEEAARLFETTVENKEVIDLARELVKGELDWQQLTGTLKAMPEMPAESIRIIIAAYLTSCLMGSKTEKQTTRLLDMLECFSQPMPATDKLAPLLLAFGRYIYP